MYNAKKRASNRKWDTAHLDRFSVAFRKEFAASVRAAAAAAGQSVNAYILAAVKEKMERE